MRFSPKPFWYIVASSVLIASAIAGLYLFSASTEVVAVDEGAEVSLKPTNTISSTLDGRDIDSTLNKEELKQTIKNENVNNRQEQSAYYRSEQGQRYGVAIIDKPFLEPKPISELIDKDKTGSEVKDSADVCVICQGSGVKEEDVRQIVVDAIINMGLLNKEQVEQLLLDGKIPFSIDGETAFLSGDIVVDRNKKPLLSNGKLLRLKDGAIVGDDGLIAYGLDGNLYNASGQKLNTSKLTKDQAKSLMINGVRATIDENGQLYGPDGEPLLDENDDPIFYSETDGLVNSNGEKSALSNSDVVIDQDALDGPPMVDGKATYVDENGVLHYMDGTVVTDADGNPIKWSAEDGFTNMAGEKVDMQGRVSSNTDLPPMVDGKATYVDENGVLHYMDGTVVTDADGKPIKWSAEGGFTTEDGEPVDMSGRISPRPPMIDGKATYVDENGVLHYMDGTVVRDKDGNPIKWSAEGGFTTEDGKPVDMKGRIDSNSNLPPMVDGKATYVDENGVLHYMDGTVVTDENGNPIKWSAEGGFTSEDGKPVDMTGRLASHLGSPPMVDGRATYVDENGILHYMDGTVVTDENGNPIKWSAENGFTSEDGKPVDMSGRASYRIVDGEVLNSISGSEPALGFRSVNLTGTTGAIAPETTAGGSVDAPETTGKSNKGVRVQFGKFHIQNDELLSQDFEPLIWRGQRVKVKEKEGQFLSDTAELVITGDHFTSSADLSEQIFIAQRSKRQYNFFGDPIINGKSGFKIVEGKLYAYGKPAFYNSNGVFINKKDNTILDSDSRPILAVDSDGSQYSISIGPDGILFIAGQDPIVSSELISGVLTDSSNIVLANDSQRLTYEQGVYSLLAGSQNVGVLKNGIITKDRKPVYDNIGNKLAFRVSSMGFELVGHLSKAAYKGFKGVLEEGNLKWFQGDQPIDKTTIYVYNELSDTIPLFDQPMHPLIGTSMYVSENGHVYLNKEPNSILLDVNLMPYTLIKGILTDSSGETYEAISTEFVDDSGYIRNIDGQYIYDENGPLGEGAFEGKVSNFTLFPRLENGKPSETSKMSELDPIAVSSSGVLYYAAKTVKSSLGYDIKAKGGMLYTDAPDGVNDAYLAEKLEIANYFGLTRSLLSENLIVRNDSIMPANQDIQKNRILESNGGFAIEPMRIFIGWGAPLIANGRLINPEESKFKKLINGINRYDEVLVTDEGDLLNYEGEYLKLKGNKVISIKTGKPIITPSGEVFANEKRGLSSVYGTPAKLDYLMTKDGRQFDETGTEVSKDALIKSNIKEFYKDAQNRLYTEDLSPVLIKGQHASEVDGKLQIDGDDFLLNGDSVKIRSDGTLTTNGQDAGYSLSDSGDLTDASKTRVSDEDESGFFDKLANGFDGISAGINNAVGQAIKNREANRPKAVETPTTTASKQQSSTNNTQAQQSESVQGNGGETIKLPVYSEYDSLAIGEYIVDRAVLDELALSKYRKFDEKIALATLAANNYGESSNVINVSAEAAIEKEQANNATHALEDQAPGRRSLTQLSGSGSTDPQAAAPQTLAAATIISGPAGTTRVLKRGDELTAYVKIPYSSYGKSVIPLLVITGGVFSGATLTPSAIEEMSNDLLLAFDTITLPDGRKLKTNQPFAASYNKESGLAGSGAEVDDHYWERLSIIIPYALFTKAGTVIEEAAETTTTDEDTDTSETETDRITGDDLSLVLASSVATETRPIFDEKLESLVKEYKLTANQQISILITSDVFVPDELL